MLRPFFLTDALIERCFRHYCRQCDDVLTFFVVNKKDVLPFLWIYCFECFVVLDIFLE